MSSAEERKKAREAYLLQLNQDRQTQKPQPPPPASNQHHQHHQQHLDNNNQSHIIDRRTDVRENNGNIPDNQFQSHHVSSQNNIEKRVNIRERNGIIQEDRHYAPPPQDNLRERQQNVREELSYHDSNQRRNDVRENRAIMKDDQSQSMQSIHPGERRHDIKERKPMIQQQEDQLYPYPGHQSNQRHQPIRYNYPDNVNPSNQIDSMQDNRHFSNNAPLQPLQHNNVIVQEQPVESRSFPTRNPLFLNPVEEEKAMKRQKQQEYANQLRMQLDERKPQGKQSMSHENIANRQSVYSNLNVIENGHDDSLQKRKKQEEYAKMLQEQMHMKLPAVDSNYGNDQRSNNSKRNQYSNNVVAEPQLAEGWVIGPLGIPVRKTLETGHRGVQKTYHQNIGSNSPQKIPPPDNFNYRNESNLACAFILF